MPKQDAVQAGMGLEACRQVHHAANNGVIHAVLAAEIPHGAIAGIDADAEVKGPFGAELLPFGLQLAQAPLHGNGHAHAGACVLLYALR